MSEQVIPERYKKDLPQLNLDDERDFYIYQLWQEVGAAEAKVAEQAATIADKDETIRTLTGLMESSTQGIEKHAATIERLNRVNTLQRAMLSARDAEPIPLSVLLDDEKLMRTNLQKCYSSDTLAFRVSAEHYRYLAEQVISLRTHIKRSSTE
jgi:hypothetical protein